MRDIQRKLNTFGGIRTVCISSEVMLQKMIDTYFSQGERTHTPSLIIVSYQMLQASAHILELFKSNPSLAGVPLAFMVEAGEDINKDEYYLQGAMLVLEKPFDKKVLFRIQQAAGQYELTKSYERILQKQMSELAAAKEIQRLNVQLEQRNKFLHQVFGKYFSDELLELLMEKQEGEFIGGSRVPMAVLMADLRGFSSKSEQMELDELMELLNYFFGTMAEIITRHQGTIIELMGDGILAVFGALIKNEAYAEAALASAIEMQNEMQNINMFCEKKQLPAVELGIGIHCGTAFVGNVGSEQMMRYNVIGRVVNECSRIESCSIGGQIFISDEALQQMSGRVDIARSASVAAKGIREPLKIYEVSGLDGAYTCSLAKKQELPMQTVTEPLTFELHQIANKMISDKKLTGRVLALNVHDIQIEVLEECSTLMLDEVPVFSDLELRTGADVQASPFSGVYAKVIKQEGRQLWLHVTHVNKEFQQFLTTVR